MLNLNSRDPFEAIWRRETRHETESKNNKNITNPIDKQKFPEEHFRRRKGARRRERKRTEKTGQMPLQSLVSRGSASWFDAILVCSASGILAKSGDEEDEDRFPFSEIYRCIIIELEGKKSLHRSSSKHAKTRLECSPPQHSIGLPREFHINAKIMLFKDNFRS